MENLPRQLKSLEHEEDRLASLYSYHLLDTEMEGGLIELNHLAASICGTPISLIVLLDKNRQVFKSKYGWDKSETERAFSFCHYTILEEEEIMEVENALQDKRFEQNPLVTGDPHIRFYCGSPLVNAEGYRLGALCVIDQKPGKLNASQKEALVVLSRQVVMHFELHKQKLLLEKQKEELETTVDQRTIALKEINDELKTFIYKASHDIRGPIATILGLSELGAQMVHQASEQEKDKEEFHFFFNQIAAIGRRLDETLKNLLRIMRLKESEMAFREIGAEEVKREIEKIIENFKDTVPKDVRLHFFYEVDPSLQFRTEKELFTIILRNVIDNSVKFFDKNKKNGFVKIAITEEGNNRVKVIVQDNGEGIEPQICDRVYDIFFRGNARSQGSGLGLFIAKKAVEKLDGEIYFTSKPHELTTFTIYLKKRPGPGF